MWKKISVFWMEELAWLHNSFYFSKNHFLFQPADKYE